MTTDRQIVALLRTHGRLCVGARAEQVHISRANAYTRLERLHTEGVIIGYAARVDPDRLGLGTAAYDSVSIQFSRAPGVGCGPRSASWSVWSAWRWSAPSFDMLARVRA